MSRASAPICEVRVPTYRRPVLLERALRSICAQTYPDWRCVVFDDCANGSAQAVVEAIGDPRIGYRKNPNSLGAIGNIDQCFRNRAYVDGQYACVVEDDNFLLSEHLAHQLDLVASHGVEVVFSAQACEEVLNPGEPGRVTEIKTIAWIYPEGVHPSAEVQAAILFSHAFSNGSAFWRLGCATDFEMGPLTQRPGVQETARILRLEDNVCVSHQATAIWRANDPRDSYVSASDGGGRLARLKARWGELLERREITSLRRHYLSAHGLSMARRLADHADADRKAQIESALLMCGRFTALTQRTLPWRLSWLIRGLLFRLIVPSQLAWPDEPGRRGHHA
jgi:glycosyltransferase involved in cell wall biosynthesis